MQLRTIILLIACFSALSGEAQSSYLANITHYGVEEGLSHREVFDVHQDQQGLIWIATRYGINRFDGKDFKWWTKEEQGLASNTVHHLLEDAEGWLWAFSAEHWFYGTNIQHLSLVNIYSGEVLSPKERFGDSTALDFSNLHMILSDGEGGLLLHTHDFHNFHFHPHHGFKALSTDTYFLPRQQQRASRKEGIWGIKKSTTTPGKFLLAQLNANGQTVQYHPLDKGEGRLDLFFPAQKQSLWFSHSNTVETPKLYKYANQKISDSLDILSFNPAVPPGSIFTDWTNRLYFQPGPDFFWFKAYPYLYTFHPEEGLIYDFRVEHQSLIDADIQNIEFDKDGTAWVCTVNGLYQVTLQANPFQRLLYQDYKSYHVNKAYSCRGIWANQDQVYINSYKGRVILDKTDQSIEELSVVKAENGKPLLVGRLFFPLSIKKSKQPDVLWFGEIDLVKHQLSTRNEEVYTWSEGTKEIWSIYEDAQQRVWVGTGKYGIGYMNEQRQQLQLVEGLPDNLQKSQVYAFTETSGGWVWLSTNTGLYRWSPEKGVSARFWSGGNKETNLPIDNIQHLHEDKNGTLWLATLGGGLLRLELNNFGTQIIDLQQFTIVHGLPNNVLYGVYEDDFGHLWLSSDYGIIQFDKASYHIQTYLTDNGITHHEFNRISHFQDEEGRIYFGGLNGVTTFHPKNFQQLTDERPSPPLRITEFQQYDGEREQLINKTADIQRNKQIVLKPGDRFFRLQFALLDYKTPLLNRYAWKIEGIDQDWNYISENSIRVSGLAAGKYTLLLKGQAADGRWSDQDVRIQLEVQDYFYKKSWFWIACAGLLILGIVLFFNWRNRSLRHRQLLLEQEVKKRTATIQKQAEELQHLDRVKSRFFANVSHELRTPLTLVLAPIRSALRDQQLNNRTNTYLQMAQQNGQKLLQLVNEILDLTKLEHTEIALKEQAIVFYPFIRRIIAGFESWAQTNKQEFIFHYQPEKQLKIQLDADKFEKVLNNLLSNAFKFTPAGGQIEVTVKELPHQLQVIVADTGRGIHPDDLPHVFDRFYQTKRPTTADEGGTGIGLALCKEFAQLMQGKLRVESALSEGSTFYFEFPKKEVLGSLTNEEVQAIDSAEAGIPVPIIEPLPASPSEDQPTVLLVEDNPDLRAYIQLILHDTYTVQCAENGQIALEMLENDLPELIISDVMMPVVDGFQLLEQLKTSDQWRHIPVIMLTARAQLRDKLKALRIGVDDYMVKPFVEEELLTRMHNLLQNASNRHTTANSGSARAQEKPPLSAADAQWLETQESLLQKELSNPEFSVNSWAAQTFLSERQLQRKVKQLTGLSPLQYIVAMRLQEGRRLLEDRQYTSVAEVAYAIGFSQPQSFTRQFRKHFGRVPSEYF